jgi:hypothetical protein
MMWACVGLMVVLWWHAASLFAQTSATTKTVVAGEETPLVEAKEKIEVKAAPRKGTARVDTSGTGNDQIFKLFYAANQTLESTTDEIQYQVGTAATPQKVTLTIQPKPMQLTPQAYEASFKALFVLFVLAVVLESALAVLFNWRPFVETFNARAVRPLVSFIVAYLFVEAFTLDIVTSLINAATTGTHRPSVPGKILTALVLAGGSAGVNNLLVALGYRQKKTPETTAPSPPPDRAWIALRVDRKLAARPVNVFLGARPAAGRPPLVGVIKGSSKPGLRFFLSDPGRFPGYGGHQVPASSEIAIDLVSTDAANNAVEIKWGPHTVAGGAVIDLDFVL